MKALIFAAGKGERMRPLTDHTPKPLLHVGGKALIVYHLEKLASIGVKDVVINTSWLAEQFALQLGDGSRWGLHLHYSYEGTEPLETGGGMLKALPMLGDPPFIAVNGDIWTDIEFSVLPREPAGLAHLVLVDNPAHHRQGDFGFVQDSDSSKTDPLNVHGKLLAKTNASTCLTFAGIGIYRPELLSHWQRIVDGAAGSELNPPRFKLAPLLFNAIDQDLINGTHYRGQWTDVGTPERLKALE